MSDPMEARLRACAADYASRPELLKVRPARFEVNSTHILAIGSDGQIVAAWIYHLGGHHSGWCIRRDDRRRMVPPGVMVQLGQQFRHSLDERIQ
jgi:hypothetical protein